MFENLKYGSYPQNADFDDLPFEYDQRLFTKQPIDDKIIEMLKVSLIKSSFDNLKCVSNPQNDDFNDLPFDFDQSLITRRPIYRINDNILERLKNGLIIDVYMHKK